MIHIQEVASHKTQCSLGEGIFVRNRNAFWVDINNNHIFNSENKDIIKTDLKPSVIFNQTDKNLIVGSDKGIAEVNFEHKTERLLIEICHHDFNLFRSNDGVFINGNYFLGFMHRTDPINNKGKIYIANKKEIIEIDNEIFIPNSFIALQDSSILISDSKEGKIWKFNIEENKIEKNIWKDLGSKFSPDGGCRIKDLIFISFWGDSSIWVFNEQAEILDKLNLPFKNPSNCKYDPKGKKLWVTSAREGLSKMDLSMYPQSGDTKVFNLKY